MNITDVKLRKVFSEGVLKAVLSITLDECFTIHDIKIIYVNDSYLIAMPNRRCKDGRLTDICHPINKEFRKELEEKIMTKYNSYIDSRMNGC